MRFNLRRCRSGFLLLLCGLAGFWATWQWQRLQRPTAASQPPIIKLAPRPARPIPLGNIDTPPAAGISIEAYDACNPNEVIFRFPADESYRTFLTALATSPVRLLHQLDRLRAVKLGYDRWEDVSLLLNDTDVTDFESVVELPEIWKTGGGIRKGAIPFKRSLLEWLGVTTDSSRWGTGVRVAVIDTGVAPHPDLPTRFRSIAVEPFPADLADTHPHGTAVASLIVGTGSLAPGIAPGARLISIRAIGESGVTDCFNIAAAILIAIDEGAQIINLSLGSLSPTPLEEAAVRMAQQKGIVLVAGAGNDGHNQLLFPAGYPGVVSVGSLDAGGERMGFSNQGRQLSITAPGYSINAAAPGGRYITFSGTSASAPIVAGTLAAIMSDGSGRALTGAAAVEILLAYADDIGPPGQDPEYGAGILNLNRIITRNQPGIVHASITDQRLIRGPGSTAAIQVTVQNRGTAILLNTLLEIATPLGTTSFNATTIPPGGIRSFTQPVKLDSIPAGGPLRVTSRITLSAGARDINPAEHVLTSNLPTGTAGGR